MAYNLSHNPERPSYGHTKAEYSAFFERVEQAFNVNEMTQSRLSKWLNNENLADLFSRTKDIYDRVINATTIAELRALKGDAGNLLIHRETILKLIEQRINDVQVSAREQEIARQFAVISGFAQKKKISLTENTKGNIYPNWGRYHRKAVVIFKDGKIKSWEYV